MSRLALGLLLYPFTAAAVAINLFLIALIGNALGWGSLSPMQAVLGGAVLGLPATLAATAWIRRLLARAG